MNRDTHEMLARLEHAGFSTDDALALRRISMTLQRWHELECGDSNDYCSYYIERNEDTGKPYMVTHPYNGESRRYPIDDRERGALKRLNAIMARYPEWAAYVQGDPRGAALYVYRRDSELLAGSKYGIGSCYSSVGIAVYK